MLAGAFKESFGLALNLLFAAGIEKGAGAMIKTSHQRGAWLEEGAGFFQMYLFFPRAYPSLQHYFGLGLVGIWIAMACDESVRGLLFVLRFRRGSWRRRRLVD